jgi:hypothetical protein
MNNKCTNPVVAYRAKSHGKSKKNGFYKKGLSWPITFCRSDGYTDKIIKLPCGRCLHCRLEYARNWAVRCMHEVMMHEDNSFITLTYRNRTLPLTEELIPTISKSDLQKFIKRLRNYLDKEYKKNKKIKYFACGEYGEKNERPHYHLCLFGYDFPDKIIADKSEAGNKLYHSDILDSIWQKGRADIGELNFESAGYVARYNLKKIVYEKDEEWYNGREKEFLIMSRRPGIGASFVEKYENDLYVRDCVVTRKGLTGRPPKYYDKLLEKRSSDRFLKVKIERRKNRPEEEEYWTEARQREYAKKLKIKSLKRSY